MKRLLLLAGLFISLQQLKAQDGTLDQTFGNNGMVNVGVFAATAFQSTGRLIAVKTTQSGFILLRFNLDGTPDNSFGVNGNTTITIPALVLLRSVKVAVQNNDNIVVQLIADSLSTPFFNESNIRVVHSKFNKDGKVENSFGVQGLLTELYKVINRKLEPLPSQGFVELQPDGKILSVIHWYGYSIYDQFKRYDQTGKVDLFIYDVSSYSEGNVVDIIGRADGKFLLLTNKPGQAPNSADQFYVSLRNVDGSPDQSFGESGVTTYIPPQIPFVIPIGQVAKSFVIDVNNKIVVAGPGRIIRFNSDGILDPSFGTNGVALLSTPISIEAISIQMDGKILVGGRSNGDFEIGRFTQIGTLDPTFGNNGVTKSDFGGNEGISEMIIVGNRIYAYGNGILAAYKLSSTCTPPTFLNTQPIVGNATCGNNDGQISVIPQSGIAPYQYSIDGGVTYISGPNAGFTFFNLPASTYQLRLKDANGCESAVVTRTITTTGCPTCTPPTFLNTLPIVGDASCSANDGQISIIPTSGSGPFMYSINGGTTYVSGPNAGYTFFNLAPGTYQLTLKAANGCESATITRSIVVRYGVPTFLNTQPIVGDATCNLSDGQISIIPTSGTGPFMYSINGGATYVSGPNAGYTFFNLPAGMYQLRLKAGNGCESAVVSREVKMINCPSPTPTIAGVNKGFAFDENTADAKLQIAAYPNPSKGRFNLQVVDAKAGKGELSIFDGKGTLVQKSVVNIGKGNTVPVNLTGKAPGIYYLKVVTQQGNSTSKILLQ